MWSYTVHINNYIVSIVYGEEWQWRQVCKGTGWFGWMSRCNRCYNSLELHWVIGTFSTSIQQSISLYQTWPSEKDPVDKLWRLQISLPWLFSVCSGVQGTIFASSLFHTHMCALGHDWEEEAWAAPSARISENSGFLGFRRTSLSAAYKT